MSKRWYQRPDPRPVTVARAARDEMAALVRTLATRQIDNDTFEDSAHDLLSKATDDPALWDVYWFCWGFYSDTHRHKIHKLSRDHRRWFARVILFLRTEEPYCWLPRPGAHGLRPGWRSSLGDLILYAILGLKFPVLAVLSLAVRIIMYFTPDHIAPRRPVENERDLAWPFADLQSLREAELNVILLHGLPCV